MFPVPDHHLDARRLSLSLGLLDVYIADGSILSRPNTNLLFLSILLYQRIFMPYSLRNFLTLHQSHLKAGRLINQRHQGIDESVLRYPDRSG
jgi:hypothetical protein